MRVKLRQKLAVKLSIVLHTQGIASVSLFVHRNEHGELLVSVASDKLFHIAAAPPCAGFARSLRKTPLQRFHSIIIGLPEGVLLCNGRTAPGHRAYVCCSASPTLRQGQ